MNNKWSDELLSYYDANDKHCIRMNTEQLGDAMTKRKQQIMQTSHVRRYHPVAERKLMI